MSDACRPTARDLLEKVAGVEHALHTVIDKIPLKSAWQIRFRCSCGADCYVENTAENRESLRNVPEVKS